jgi:nitroreductase
MSRLIPKLGFSMTVNRVAQAQVDPIFLDRWSPRAMSPEPIPADTLASLFEAARWAPSSSNEQSWLFMYADQPAALEKYRAILVEQNRVWADKAPVLMVLFARRNFMRNGQPNRHYAFDAGAAWMCLALQARKCGLYAHAMAGFDADKAYALFGVDKNQFEAMAAIVIGKYGDPSQLPSALQEREKPNDRKPLSEVAVRVS